VGDRHLKFHEARDNLGALFIAILVMFIE